MQVEIKIGDSILVHETLKTKVIEIDGEKIYFLDEDGIKWYDTGIAIKLIKDVE